MLRLPGGTGLEVRGYGLGQTIPLGLHSRLYRRHLRHHPAGPITL